MGTVAGKRSTEFNRPERPDSTQQEVGTTVTAQRETAHAAVDALTQRAEREEMLFNLFGPGGVARLVGLSDDEQDALCQQQLASFHTESEVCWITEPVPGDGDCFFHALERVAGPSLARVTGEDTAPKALRNAMADQLEQDLKELNQAVGDAEGTESLLDKTPYLVALPSASSRTQELTPEQTMAVDQLRHCGSWNNNTGDLFAAIASETFKLRIRVITPQGPQIFGKADWPEVWLIWRPPGHYDAIFAHVRCSTPPARPT